MRTVDAVAWAVVQKKELGQDSRHTGEMTNAIIRPGPMFHKYNAVLRGFPKAAVDSLDGNKYTTTLHLIVSAVIKLSRYASRSVPLPLEAVAVRDPIRDSPVAWDAGAGVLMVAICMCDTPLELETALLMVCDGRERVLY